MAAKNDSVETSNIRYGLSHAAGAVLELYMTHEYADDKPENYVGQFSVIPREMANQWAWRSWNQDFWCWSICWSLGAPVRWKLLPDSFNSYLNFSLVDGTAPGTKEE